MDVDRPVPTNVKLEQTTLLGRSVSVENFGSDVGASLRGLVGRVAMKTRILVVIVGLRDSLRPLCPAGTCCRGPVGYRQLPEA